MPLFRGTLPVLIALALASPALAEDPAPPKLSEQLGDILRGLTEEVGPAIDEMIEEVGPALDDMIDRMSILEEIDSFEHYGRPEVLPNGDIIIRRLEDAPAYTPPAPEAVPEAEKPGIKT